MPVSLVQGHPVKVKLAVDAAGNVALAWLQKAPGDALATSVWVARYAANTQRWDSPARVSHGAGVGVDELDLAARPGGDLAVAWRRREMAPGELRDSVWLRRSDMAADAAWLPGAAGPQRMDEPGSEPGIVLGVSLAMAPASSGPDARLGVVWTWMSNYTVQGRVWVRLADVTGFQPARVVSDVAANRELFGRIAIDSMGVATVAWQRLDGDRGSIWS
ncbi:hypothetical protein WDZ92_38450, partial [Nostoc sp. NIES-2111]